MTYGTELWLRNRLENIAVLARLTWRSDNPTITELRCVLANIERLADNAIQAMISENFKEVERLREEEEWRD
jgi:hypothetical protein